MYVGTKSYMHRSDDTDACHSQGDREHPEAGSCQTAKDDGGKPGVRFPRSIETRGKVHACMAHRWKQDKK
jgi:hypothetical protein